MRKILLALLALVLGAENGQTVEKFDNLDARQIESVFVDPITEQGDLQTFIYSLLSKPNARAQSDALIAQSAKVKALAREGGEFLETYQNLLKEDFSEIRVGFALAPEKAILRHLRVTDHSRAEKVQESSRTDLEARKLALYETSVRFSLPPTISAATIEQMRFTDSMGESIYQFYHDRYARYLIAPVEKPKETNDSVRAFKRRMVQTFEAMKATNLERFIERTRGSDSFALVFNSLSHSEEVDSAKIKSVKVDIVPPLTNARRDELNEVHLHRSLSDKFIQRYNKKWAARDFEAAQSAYLPIWIKANSEPRTSHLVVEENNGLLHDFFLSENNVSNLVNTMKPTGFFGPIPDNIILRRYLLEAASRNAMYTDVISFLEENEDRTLEEFSYRLEKRIERQNNDTWVANRTLSDRMRDLYFSLNIDSDSVRAIWAGYAVHPSYWNVRNLVGNEIAIAPARGATRGERKGQGRETKEYLKSVETERQKVRFQSDSVRTRVTYLNRLRTIAISAAVVGSLWSGYQWYSDATFHPVDVTINTFQGISPDATALSGSVRNATTWVSDKFSALKDEIASALPQKFKSTADKPLPSSTSEKTAESKKGQDPLLKIHFKSHPGFGMSEFDNPQNFQIESGHGSRLSEMGSLIGEFGWRPPFTVDGETDKIIWYLIPGKSGMEFPKVYDVASQTELSRRGQ